MNPKIMNPPKAFYDDIKNFKVFVLGADPTTDQHLEFQYVFNILGNDQRYFAGILRNLEAIGLSRNDIYVQNLIQDYQNEETEKNKDWIAIAERNYYKTKEEFNEADPSKLKPVLVTAERIMKFLCHDEIPKADEIYTTKHKTLPVPADKNKLGRPLYPFYRYFKYDLTREFFKAYREYLHIQVNK